MATFESNEIVPYESDSESSGESSDDESISSVESQEESTKVIEPVIKVNWTQHGGGTDGYYYKLQKKEDLKPIHEDFVSVRVLLNDINDELPKERKIKSLKIFRWTSPGAVLVTNEDIDDKFRKCFEHPAWYDLYTNKQLKTRSGMGKDMPSESTVVGAEEGMERGPGELLKDLHLAKYRVGDEEKEGKKYEDDVFTNELISSEYENKYTNMVKDDFGLWFLRDTGEYGRERGVEDVVFMREYPEAWGGNEVERGNKLQKLHDDIFKIGQGKAGDAMSSKMSVVIKKIILGSSLAVRDNDEWNKNCQNWEFYPISCSPMSGVEGREELVKIEVKGYQNEKSLKLLDKEQSEFFSEKQEKELEKVKITRKRLNVNSGLWFVYLLNVARRCLIFIEGKRKHREYARQEIDKLTDDKKKVIDTINPKDITFNNSFDVLDPAERKQLYEDINGFLQNVRPNTQKRDAKEGRDDVTFFDSVTIGTEIFNLLEIDKEGNYNPDKFIELMNRLTEGVKFDDRGGLYSKIEKDWVEGFQDERPVLDRIMIFVDEKFSELKKKQEELKKKQEEDEGFMGKGMSDEDIQEQLKVPHVIKILFFVLYCSSHKDGIAKSYWTDSANAQEEDLYMKSLMNQKKKGLNESMGWFWGKFTPPSYQDFYDFSNAVSGFYRSVLGRLHVIKEDKGGRMAQGVRHQLTRTMGVKYREDEMGEMGIYYDFLDVAFDYKESLRNRMRVLATDPNFKRHVLKSRQDSEALSDVFKEELKKTLIGEGYYDDDFSDFIDKIILVENKQGDKKRKVTNRIYVKINDDKGVIEITKRGGSKKRKKRTRRKRKKKRKKTRKNSKKKRNCKKRMKKKIICLSAPNKKATRKLIRVTKKLARMKGIRLSKCSKQRIKKWGKKKKRTRRKR